MTGDRPVRFAGWDSVGTFDHLLAIFGASEQPILDGWTSPAALGSITQRVRLGLLVGANTFRNGFRTIVVRLPTPYDRETIDRIGEVGALLADA